MTFNRKFPIAVVRNLLRALDGGRVRDAAAIIQELTGCEWHEAMALATNFSKQRY